MGNPSILPADTFSFLDIPCSARFTLYIPASEQKFFLMLENYSLKLFLKLIAGCYCNYPGLKLIFTSYDRNVSFILCCKYS